MAIGEEVRRLSSGFKTRREYFEESREGEVGHLDMMGIVQSICKQDDFKTAFRREIRVRPFFSLSHRKDCDIDDVFAARTIVAVCLSDVGR